jgi:uncharacterized delta-60 repeat protein
MKSRPLLQSIAFFLLSLLGTGWLIAQNGTLDPTFDNDGLLTFDVSQNGFDIAYGIDQQADGKVVAAGMTTNGGAVDALVLRMNTDGTPDLTFNANGMLTLDLSLGGSDRFLDVLIQPDQKILCAGYVNTGSSDDAVIVRLLSDGSYDSSFGTGGKVRIDFGQGEDDRVYSIALQPDGKIVAAGVQEFNNSANLLVARFTSAGNPDASFDIDGSVTFDLSNGGEDGLNAVAVAADGKIVATGYSAWGPSSNNMIIARLDASGQPDLSFSSDGFFNTAFLNGASQFGNDLQVLTDGSVLAAGSSRLNGLTNAMMLKVKNNGILDNSFNSDGVAYYDFSLGGEDVFRKIEIQSDGKIIAGGYMERAGTDRDFMAAKLLANGDLDLGFGTSGWTAADMGNSTSDYAQSMCVLNDGRILLGGFADDKIAFALFTNENAVGITDPFVPNHQIKTWPQPFGNNLKVELPASIDGIATLEIYNLNGQLQHSRTIGNTHPAQVLDLSNDIASFATGMYVLKISSGTSVYTAKLIKE